MSLALTPCPPPSGLAASSAAYAAAGLPQPPKARLVAVRVAPAVHAALGAAALAAGLRPGALFQAHADRLLDEPDLALPAVPVEGGPFGYAWRLGGERHARAEALARRHRLDLDGLLLRHLAGLDAAGPALDVPAISPAAWAMLRWLRAEAGDRGLARASLHGAALALGGAPCSHAAARDELEQAGLIVRADRRRPLGGRGLVSVSRRPVTVAARGTR